MHNLLHFNPEPFADLPESQSEPDHEEAFAGDEMEEERGGRRPRRRSVPSQRGGRRPAWRQQAARGSVPARSRLSGGRSGRSKSPGTLPPRPGRRGIRFPVLPFIPLVRTIFPTSEPSEYVRWVQSALNDVLGLRLAVDGIMDAATRSAVRSFQQRQGLPVDGIVGPDTERALSAARKRQAPATDAGTTPEPGITESLHASPAEPSAADTAAAAAEFDTYRSPAYKGMARNGSRFGRLTYRPEPWYREANPPGFAMQLKENPSAETPHEFEVLELEAFEWEEEVDRRSRAYAMWVQSALNTIQGLSLGVDGIIGTRTRSAIRRFQSQQGLAVDGIVGPNTEAALIAAGAGTPPGSTAPPSLPPYTPPAAPPPPPTSTPALRNNIAQIAVQEWQRWGQGSIKECTSGIRLTLEDYWRSGVGYVPSQSNYCASVPWSAAFISWVMRRAGAGSAFRYSGRHTDYVGAAKQNRAANNSNPFKTYRISEVRPRVGDLVCLERNNSGVSYDNVDQGPRDSHCDIVVDVHPGRIKTIGGNLSDSVRQNTVATDANGRVSTAGYYAVVRVGV